MRNWVAREGEACPAREDLRDAMAVAEHLNIPLHIEDFHAEYEEEVFAEFVATYARGETPNPDIWCNQHIKFKHFLNAAKKRGFDAIATGHYAKTENGRLYQAQDTKKDQTYFLYTLTTEQLAYTVFPLAALTKQEVRAKAAALGLTTHNKKDSVGICFIGAKNLRTFLATYLPAKTGDIVDDAGTVIGEHIGAHFYTIGQRKGLAIGGTKGGSGAPWYVIDKDMAANRVIVHQGADHPSLYNTRCGLRAVHWIGDAPPPGIGLKARIRHGQALQDAHVEYGADGRAELIFDAPQWAMAAGQSAVLYSHEACLGGGIMCDIGGVR